MLVGSFPWSVLFQEGAVEEGNDPALVLLGLG
jgi:hypothetical protein